MTKAIFYKIVALCLLSKLNIFKVMRQYKAIFKSAFAISLISSIYLTVELCFKTLRQYKVIPRSKIALNIQSFLAGIIASLGTQYLSKSEVTILKIFIYMRAINGGMLLIKYFINKLVNKTRGKSDEKFDL